MELGELLTTREIADRFKITTQTVRDMVRDGRLEGVRFGRQFRVLKVSVERAIEQVESNEIDRG